MKIAFILSTCDNFGPFVVAQNIIKNIISKVELIDIYYLKESTEKLQFGVKCRKISMFECLDFSKYDILHSHGFKADAYIYIHRKKIKSKKITSIHQTIYPDYSMAYNKLVALILESVWCHFLKIFDQIVTLSKDMIFYYKDKLDSNKMIYIYNGIDIKKENSLEISEKKNIFELKKKYYIIGVVARLTFRKGIDQLINLLSVAKEYAIVVIGDGEEKKMLIEQAKLLDVNDRCLFLGYKNNAIDYYKFFDVFALTSRSEGFGLVVMEAISQNIPVVCSDLPIYREIFDDNEVVKFELENIQSLKESLSYAFKNKKYITELAMKKYRIHFTSEIMANNYFKLYLSLLSTNN